jgi:hypothetical protein
MNCDAPGRKIVVADGDHATGQFVVVRYLGK